MAKLLIFDGDFAQNLVDREPSVVFHFVTNLAPFIPVFALNVCDAFLENAFRYLNIMPADNAKWENAGE